MTIRPEMLREKVIAEIKKENPYYSDENIESRRGGIVGAILDCGDEEAEMLAWALEHGSEELKSLVSQLRRVAPGCFRKTSLVEKVKPGKVKPGGRVDFSEDSSLKGVDEFIRDAEKKVVRE